MGKTLGPSPGPIRHLEHTLSIKKERGHWTASLNGSVVADSHDTLLLDETRFGRTVYFPPNDVAVRNLRKSDSRTTCPFKGEANYFAAEIDGKIRDVAWFYPAVYDEMADIEGYIAFYADRVDVVQESTSD